MQAFEFDYCDTYDSYGTSRVVLENNGLKMFTCHECRGQKTFVKKSVSDSKFRCDSCIQTQTQNQNEIQAQMSILPNSLVLEMPTPSTTTTTDETAAPQYSWRWLHFFT
jgi:transcription elongation factor Elf1